MMVNTATIIDPFDPSVSGTGNSITMISRKVMDQFASARFNRGDLLTVVIGRMASSNDWATVRDQIDEIRTGYTKNNWDGEGASRVTEKTIKIAESFLRQFPSYLPLPEVSAEPDGDINLEWYINNNFVYEVSLNESGMIYYAGRFNGQKISGSLPFNGNTPEILESSIRRFI